LANPISSSMVGKHDGFNDGNSATKFLPRKARSFYDSKALSSPLKKNLSSDSYTEPPVSLYEVSRDGKFERLESLLNNLSKNPGLNCGSMYKDA
jgi:hypothetical protein